MGATSSRPCLEVCFAALDLRGRRTWMSFRVGFWSFQRNLLCGQIQNVSDLQHVTLSPKSWQKELRYSRTSLSFCLVCQSAAIWNVTVKSWTFFCNSMACTCWPGTHLQASLQNPCRHQCWRICFPLSPNRTSWRTMQPYYWPCLPVLAPGIT